MNDKTQSRWDTIIVGQGLAGTTLAWHLHLAGQRVLVIDGCEDVTSSRIAAGLITPITGKRLVLAKRYGDYLSTARKFYTSIENQTGETFFHERIGLRLFQSAEERDNWTTRSGNADYQTYLTQPQPDPLLDPKLADSSGGGFAMNSAQLDVAAYLQASRSTLTCMTNHLDWQRDISFDSDGVSVLGARARRVISCEGHAASRNPYFLWVPFLAAKGDILTIRLHQPMPPHSIHRGIWIAPTSDRQIFRVGSTYDWDNLDQRPSAQARSEIEDRLKAFFNVPYDVLDHRAAVRPIIAESNAFIGLHPEQPALGFFNGLGSKGALHAPRVAQVYADFLLHQTPLPDHMDVVRFFVSEDARR